MTRFKKIRYNCRQKYISTEKYISKLYYNNRARVISYIKSIKIFTKIGRLITYFLEILFTGFIIKYAITNFNPLSLGLLAALFTYYIEWFVKLIKHKEEQ